jgi:hypothetical protein
MWSLAEVMANPQAAMRAVIRHMAPNLTSDPTMPPVLMASNVLATVLQELKNQGMHPVLAGDFGPPLSFDHEI